MNNIFDMFEDKFDSKLLGLKKKPNPPKSINLKLEVSQTFKIENKDYFLKDFVRSPKEFYLILENVRNPYDIVKISTMNTSFE